MNGYYLAARVRALVLPYLVAYKACVLEDILPVFNNIDQRAEEFTNNLWTRLIFQPAGEDFDGDLSGHAEHAIDEGVEYHQTKTSLRQASLNLYTAGLYHVLEQQLAEVANDAGFYDRSPGAKLSVLRRWYDSNVGIHLRTMEEWPQIQELRLLANTIKHAAGPSADQLREAYPEYFENPAIQQILGDSPTPPPAARRPLAGGNVFVTEDDFTRMADAVISLARTIETTLRTNGEELLPLGS